MAFAKLFLNFLLNSNLKNFRIKAKDVLGNGSIWKPLKNSFSSVKSFKMWFNNCDYLLSLRIKKGRRFLSLYSRILTDRSFKDFWKQFRLHFLKSRKDILLGIVGVSVYDWNTNRISDEEMHQHFNAFDYAYLLRDKTITCSSCKERQTYDNWTVFIEKQDMVVWRRPHSSGNFEYKVYGSYDDVSGEDFLNVQIDTKYRQQWDNTAIILNVVDTDPNIETNSDIVYWEMQWPKFFTNRDYVFNRRFIVDCDRKMIVIISKSTTHPACPVEKNKYRVTDYFSAMVVKPYTELNKPGIEFVLTYFDNPGVNIPNSINSWVAMRAMPDFLTRLREATKHYKAFCEKTNHSCICTLTDRTGERKKKDCRKRPKPVKNAIDDKDEQELKLFGLYTGEIEKAFESMKDNVENKLDDFKDDIKKVLSRLTEDFIENQSKNDRVVKQVNTQTDCVEKVEQKDGAEGGEEKATKEGPEKGNVGAEEVMLAPSPMVKNEGDVKSSETPYFSHNR